MKLQENYNYSHHSASSPISLFLSGFVRHRNVLSCAGVVMPKEHRVIQLRVRKEGCTLLVSRVPENLCPLLAERWFRR